MDNLKSILEVNIKKGSEAKNNNSQKTYEDMRKTKAVVGETNTIVGQISKKISKIFSKGAIIGWATIIKDSINYMIKATEKQANYIENLNMMQVAFGQSAEQAEKYIDTITNATGFDPSTLTRQLGVFRQISSAMKYTSETADLLSTNLSKLSIDVASLYNTDIQRAGKALESAITGQVRSIRSLTGVDITQATLKQEALALGIEKSITQMSRAEKTILIYLSLERQLANANGDAARTINSVANQTKIFKDQIAVACRQLGSVFIPILKTLLPILNGIIMAFNTIVGMLLSFFGIDVDDMAKEFGVASSGLGTIEDGLNGVSQASEKAKKSLRGFDKLNNITTPDKGSGGGVGGAGIGGIDNKLLAALDEYNLQLDKMKNKAAEIRDSILEWLGFSKNVNGEWEFSHITLGTILGTMGAIVGGIKIYRDVAGVFKMIGGFLTGSSKGEGGASDGGIVGIISGFGGLIAKAFGAETAGTMTPFLIGLGGLATTAAAFWGTILLIKNTRWDEAFSWWNEGSEETNQRIEATHTKVEELKSIIDGFSYSGLVMSEEDYSAVIAKIQELKSAALSELDDWYTQEISKLDELYPTEELKQSESYKTQLEEIKKHYNNSQTELNGYIKEYTEKFSKFYKDDKKIDAEERLELLKIQKKFDGWSIEALSNGYEEKSKLQDKFNNEYEKNELKADIKELENAKKQQKEIIETANATYNERIKKAAEYYGKDTEEYNRYVAEQKIIRDKTINDANNDYEKFYNNWATSHQDILTYIDKDTGTVFLGIQNAFGGLDGSISAIQDSLEGKSTAFVNNILSKFNTLKKEYLQLSKDLGKPISYDVKPSGKSNSSYQVGLKFKADGGFVDSGEMFVARENGLTEYVGSFGNKTAVANNDQIVKGISVGVAKAMMAVGNSQPSKVTIEAKGDTSGLLNFITFEQKKQNRQYGL